MTEYPGPAGMRALQALPQPPDPAAVLEIVRTMRGELAESMGIEITEFTPERVTATMPVVGNRQPFGLLHGGASCALMETIGSWAGALHAGPDKQVVGIELNASYLRGATSGVVTAVCTPVRRGRTLSTFLIEITDESGRPTATGRLTTLTKES